MFDIGAAWNVTKNVKLRSGVLNVGDKDLSRDDYGYTERMPPLLYGRRLPLLTGR